MCFLIEDDDLSEKYNTIWDRVTSDISQDFDCDLIDCLIVGMPIIKLFEDQTKILR